jgi:hypothetical protein
MADRQLDRFYRVFTTALERGSAAAFIGAGISCSVGYPTWRGLLKEIAAELKILITRAYHHNYRFRYYQLAITIDITQTR